MDVPIGPNNRIEPGGPDQGQPTHFEPSQQHGVFAIRVPKDFGTQKLTWTLVVNGQTASISFWLNPPYVLDFFRNAATGNEPPVIKFAPGRSRAVGPPARHRARRCQARWDSRCRSGCGPRTCRPRSRARLRNWQSSAAGGPPCSSRSPSWAIRRSAAWEAPARGRPDPTSAVNWKKYRGPGRVTVAQPRVPLITKKDPKLVLQANTTATFDAPGDYVLRVHVNDESGEDGGGDQCCWTTALVRVSVK